MLSNYMWSRYHTSLCVVGQIRSELALSEHHMLEYAGSCNLLPHSDSMLYDAAVGLCLLSERLNSPFLEDMRSNKPG